MTPLSKCVIMFDNNGIYLLEDISIVIRASLINDVIQTSLFYRIDFKPETFQKCLESYGLLCNILCLLYMIDTVSKKKGTYEDTDYVNG